jgi:uncharacterized protein YqjF (DUF2071 family)
MHVSPEEREWPRRRPDERPIGYQCWKDLFFIHWRVDAEILRPLVSSSLEIDTYDGSAWLGLVPFYMTGVRPARLPAVPWVSNFCETNLRTYVHRNGKAPGVWFFSLDAARLLAVQIARWKWNLSYFWARMQMQKRGSQIEYQSRRIKSSNGFHASTEIAGEFGEFLPNLNEKGYESTLEFFLAERYLLYTEAANQVLLRGQIHHPPYQLRRASINKLDQSISDAVGIECGAPDHAVFCDGVTVDIFPLRPVEERARTATQIELCVEGSG